MNILVISMMSTVLYGLGTIYQLLAYLRKLKLNSITAFFIGVSAAMLQLILTGHQITSHGSYDFGILNSASLFTGLIVLALACFSFKRPLHSIMLFIYPFSIASLIGATYWNEGVTLFEPASKGILAHIALSVIAYCILSIAALQAVLIYIQNNNLKKKNDTILMRNLPPLLTMERLLFEMLWSGTLVLAAAITAGFIFVDNLFAQQLAHKTFFSLLSLVIFSTLLFGRQKYGWRGIKASKMTLWGAAFLMLGFFGSKFVLEWVLAQS